MIMCSHSIGNIFDSDDIGLEAHLSLDRANTILLLKTTFNFI